MREVICIICQELKPYYARGKCKKCYAHGQYKLDYEKNREKYLLRAKQHREENPDYHREYRKKYYQEYRDELIEHSAQWNRNNPEKRRATRRRYYEKNLEKYAIYNSNRRARKRKLPDTLTSLERREKLIIGCCLYCGRREGLELDHFVPLSAESNYACGTTRANSVLACRKCNSSKGNKLPTEIISQLTLFF